MNYNDINRQRLIDALLSSSGGKLSRDTINRAADSKDASSLINSLSPEDRERLNKVMSGDGKKGQEGAEYADGK